MINEPIFFAWTRSFWASVAGFAVLFFEAPPDVLRSIGVLLDPLLPWTGVEIGETLVKVAPGLLWLFALHQRSGAARPYSVSPKDV